MYNPAATCKLLQKNCFQNGLKQSFNSGQLTLSPASPVSPLSPGDPRTPYGC